VASTKASGKSLDFGLINRVLQYTRPYKKKFRLTLFLTILLALLGPVRPYLISYTVDHFIITPNMAQLAIFCLILVGILGIETLIQYYQTYFSGYLGQQVVKDIRQQLFNRMSRFKLQYYDKTPIGTLVTRVINDVETISDVFSEGLLSIIGDVLKLLVIFVFMFTRDWQLTLACLIPVPVLLIATNVFRRGIGKSFKEVRNEVSNMNAFTQEHITGMHIIQAFNREEIELDQFKKINHQHRKANIKSVWYYSIFFPVVEILSALSVSLMVFWAARDMIIHTVSHTSPGLIIEFILYINMMYRPMRQLADRFNTLQMGVVSSERIFKVMDTNEALDDRGTLKSDSIHGNIRFENVSFSYVENEPVLENFELTIQQGEKIAIVGATGSGKTTIINLVSRMYEINSGHIYFDGIDIKEFQLSELQKSIGVVLQDVFLFSDSVTNNIRLRNDDISEEQVIEAAKAVGAHEFIMQLPGGYAYQIGERGTQLSVGQRQLISFIRAYVYNPKVLILDEATSSIDTESELLIQKATEKITEGRTSIIIAHRLSTIKNVDKILVMEKGKIIESGNHQELLAQQGMYKKLFELQFSANHSN
jgi:ATP-binding cassette subfamily B multidrug efflux pump